MPPLRTISTTETEGLKREKKESQKKVLEKLARIKKMITFAPRLTTESQQESGFRIEIRV